MGWDIGKTAEFYDEVAATYDERGYSLAGPDYPANHFRLEIAMRVLESLPPGSVLDAGCGTGLLLAHIAATGRECAGFDLSAGMLAQARDNLGPELAERVTLVQAAGHDLGMFADSSFDHVFCLGVFPYIPADLEDATYRELRRVIKPGGVFVTAHENELFDLFTFNKYTLRFFERNVLPLLERHDPDVDAARLRDALSTLISRPDEPVNRDPGRSGRDIILTRPENPLIYGEKLARHGFCEEDVLYYHFHAAPPLIRNESEVLKELSRRLELVEARAWQGMFMASTFVSVARAAEEAD